MMYRVEWKQDYKVTNDAVIHRTCHGVMIGAPVLAKESQRWVALVATKFGTFELNALDLVITGEFTPQLWAEIGGPVKLRVDPMTGALDYSQLEEVP